MKKVSMVVINYNDKERVTRAIESCINQSYKQIEVIVVDDGSDEQTREIYKQFGENIKLVQLERTEKSLRTPSRARNEGISVATGEYICFLDSDNYFEKDFVLECMKYDNDVMFVNWQIIGKQQADIHIERVWQPENDILTEYMHKTHLDHQCLLIKRSVLDEIGYYDERLPRSQDCDMIVRLMLATQDWYHIPKRLFFFEKHEEDQMKTVASMHGKTLWCLKLNMDLSILISRCFQVPLLFFALLQGVNDFFNNDEWKEDREKSNYTALWEKLPEVLNKEVSE
jgi:glycosyltransferase involved in cell wall biosynthesis